MPAVDTSSSLIFIGVAAAIAYVALLWIALAFWMVRDARRRTPSIIFGIFAFVIGLGLPFIGALIYLVVRPPLTIDEERALALEEQALTELPDETGSRPCPTCGRDIESEFVICPYCRTQFARRCLSCQRWLRLGWRICPYCAAEIGVQSVPGPGRALTS
jgi:RNA polymerase subunit RPABC4/transcription elongation factor Spt4